MNTKSIKPLNHKSFWKPGYIKQLKKMYKNWERTRDKIEISVKSKGDD